MENSREYFFDHQSSRIDVCREGREPVPEAECRSFIWDDKIKGITLQEDVYSSGNVNEERQVKVKVVIIKNEDCEAFAEARSRYCQWQEGDGNVLPYMKMDSASYRKILEMYGEASRKSAGEIAGKMVYSMEVDYSMPAGRETDVLALTVPIDIEKLETDTVYRIGIIENGDLPLRCNEWACFNFFRLAMPVEEAFVPYSAYLKVRKPIGGKLYFDRAADYRHYSDFFSDIHFDRICGEVEVNPALVCFDLEVKCSKKDIPFFSIVLRSADEVLYRGICRLADVEGTDRITVFCPLSSENLHVKDYKEITASLRAFGRGITSFRFFTDRTEQGKFRFNLFHRFA